LSIRIRPHSALAALAALLLLACSAGRGRPTPTPVSSATATVAPAGPVSAALSGGELAITNGSPATIYYAVYRQEVLPLIEWAPCDHPQRCGQERIRPGESVRLPLATVAKEGTEVVAVFWWHLEQTAQSDRFLVTDLTMIEVAVG
jgi:hypothetical protein